MKLTLTLEEEIVLLNKYKITPNELTFIKTLLILQNDGIEDLFASYIQCINVREIILSLQAKEIILKKYKIPSKGSEFSPYEIPINKIFLRNLYKASFELGKELFDHYPQFGNIKGNVIPLRTVARHFDSLEDAYFKYGKYIGWNPEKHEKIIELLDYAKEHDILNCSLSSFIINNGWNDLEAIKNGENCNINYDAIKIV